MKDSDGYPLDSDLRRIEDWPVGKNLSGLMGLVRECWWQADWGFRGPTQRGRYYLSTGGWSGNEDVIHALRRSESLFWSFCWIQSRRGGHHVFEIRKSLRT